MSTTKLMKSTSEIQTRNIGFHAHDVDYIIRGVRTSNILISKDSSSSTVLTQQNLEPLRGRTVKIRFSGVSRARMGEIIKSLKSNNCSVYVKPVKSSSTKRPVKYYDVLIKREEN